MNYFIIKSKLPSLNDFISANRSNKFYGAKFKKDTEQTITTYIQEYINKGTLKSEIDPVVVFFEWHERTHRRDADNIASAKKFILDALVKNQILIDDSRKYVVGFKDMIVDDTNDYVVVEIRKREKK